MDVGLGKTKSEGMKGVEDLLKSLSRRESEQDRGYGWGNGTFIPPVVTFTIVPEQREAKRSQEPPGRRKEIGHGDEAALDEAYLWHSLRRRPDRYRQHIIECKEFPSELTYSALRMKKICKRSLTDGRPLHEDIADPDHQRPY